MRLSPHHNHEINASIFYVEGGIAPDVNVIYGQELFVPWRSLCGVAGRLSVKVMVGSYTLAFENAKDWTHITTAEPFVPSKTVEAAVKAAPAVATAALEGTLR